MADSIDRFPWWGLWLTTFLVLLLLTIGTLVIGSYAVSDNRDNSETQAMYGWIMIGVGIVAALATIALAVVGIIKTVRTLSPAIKRGIAAGQSEAQRAILEEDLAKFRAQEARAAQKSQARALRTGATQQQRPPLISTRAQDVLAGAGSGAGSGVGSDVGSGAVSGDTGSRQYQALSLSSAEEAAAYDAAQREAMQRAAAQARQFGALPPRVA